MADLGQQSDLGNDPDREWIRMEYAEISKHFHEIRDIRYKLFCLLPLASCGLLVLFTKFGNMADLRALLVIGPYGMAVTIALAVYEMINLEQNKELVKIGVDVENQIGIHRGPFFIRSQHAHTRYNSEMAAILIYASTLALWTVVTLIGVWAFFVKPSP